MKFLRLQIKQKLLLILFILNLILTTIYTVNTYTLQEELFMEGINQKLYAGAYGVNQLYGSDFHDRILNAGSVTQEEHFRNVKKLSEFAGQLGLLYIYSAMKFKDSVFFVTTSATEEELAGKTYDRFFTLYAEATDTFKYTFEDKQIRFVDDIEDKYGRFRSIMLPFTTPKGKVYICGADIAIDFIKTELNKTLLKTLAVGVVIFLAFFFVTYLVADRMAKPLIHLTEHIKKTIVDEFKLSKVSQDRLDQISKKSRDEVGNLAAAFISMENQLQLLLGHLEQQVTIFGKFVPKQFLECLEIKDFTDIRPKQARLIQLSVIFADIRGFTHLSEAMTPQEDFNFLNNYFARMTGPIEQNNGFIDKFLGDGIMALFTGHSDNAVKAAIGMRKALIQYNIDRKKANYRPIDIGIGINTGAIILGTVGSERRLDSTVIGDPVNTSSRLESLTKIYGVGILISEQTKNQLQGDGFLIREIDYVCVYGKEKPIRIYEVFDGDDEQLRTLKLKQLPLMNEGLAHYYMQHWDAAIRCMEAGLAMYPEDRITTMYIERCRQFKLTPPAGDWNGSFVLTTKG